MAAAPTDTEALNALAGAQTIVAMFAVAAALKSRAQSERKA